jgi:TRAP-type C4-dicarboxylate transport system permease small subunit
LLKSFDRAIAAAELAIALAFLAAILVFTAVPIFLRIFGGQSAEFTWMGPLSLYMLLTSTFFGASLAMRQRRHIQIDIVTRGLPRRAKAAFGVLGWLVAALIMGALFWASVHYVRANWTQQSKLRGVPLGPIQLGMPIALGVMTFRCLLAWLDDLRGVVTGDVAYLAAFEHTETTDAIERLSGERPAALPAPDEPRKEGA